MMLDRPSSIAVFAFTPPSFRTAGQSKAHDPRHASKLFKQAQADTTGRWVAVPFYVAFQPPHQYDGAGGYFAGHDGAGLSPGDFRRRH